MKKFLSFFLMAALILSLSLSFCACGDDAETTAGTSAPKELDELKGQTPEELYTAALEKIVGLTNFTLTMDMDIIVKADGETETVQQTVITAMNGQNEYTKIGNEAGVNMEVWYVDEMFYMIQESNQGTIKAYARIDYEDYVEKYMPNGEQSSGGLLAIPESWFENIRFQREVAGYYLEFTVDNEKYAEFITDNGLGDTVTQLGGVDAISDMIYRVYFDKDGNLGDIVISMGIEPAAGVSIEITAVSTVSKINSTEITAPADTTGWQDLTGQL